MGISIRHKELKSKLDHLNFVVDLEYRKDRNSKFHPDESILQRASCYSGLIDYLRDNHNYRSYELDEEVKLIKGKNSSSGIEDLIIWLDKNLK